MVQPLGHGVCLSPPGELGSAQMFAKGGTCGPSPSQQSSRGSGPAEAVRTTPNFLFWPRRQRGQASGCLRQPLKA